MFVILSAIPAVQSCLGSGLAIFSHAILFSLLPRYLCILPSICCGFGSYLEPVRSTIHPLWLWELLGTCAFYHPSIVALGATWNLCVLPSIHCGFGSYLETPVVWTWFCCMHVYNYLVDCIDLCTGMFSVGFFPPSLFFLAVKVFWVCGGFYPSALALHSKLTVPTFIIAGPSQFV